ncbi:MAG TPA: GFA family protein [Allosphingosinicella sp.]|nr:GFA family protein [Allosphingosinicella sp.]
MSDFPPGADPIAEPLEGRCLCGAVTIRLDGARPLVDVCHCDMCCRWGGGAFGGVSGEVFTVAGEENVTVYRSSDWAERAFCARCGSNLWYRFVPADHHSFLAGLFELPESFAMWRQIFVDEKPGWYDFAQDTPKMTGAEVLAEAKAKGFEFPQSQE